MPNLAQVCPKCGLYSPASAERCDCGHRFGREARALNAQSALSSPLRIVQVAVGSVVVPAFIVRRTVDPDGELSAFVGLATAITIGATSLWLSRLGRWSRTTFVLAYVLVAGAGLLGLGLLFACADYGSCP
jgi:hypothetical protein